MNWIVLKWTAESSGRWEQQLQHLAGASRVHCGLIHNFTALTLSHPLPFSVSRLFFPSLLLSLLPSLPLSSSPPVSRYIIDTGHIYESFQSPENWWPLLSLSLPLSFLSVYFISIPSPQASLLITLVCTVQMEPLLWSHFSLHALVNY